MRMEGCVDGISAICNEVLAVEHFGAKDVE